MKHDYSNKGYLRNYKVKNRRVVKISRKLRGLKSLVMMVLTTTIIFVAIVNIAIFLY